MSTSVLEKPVDRKTQLENIKRLESEREQAKHDLPSAIKTFFCFAVNQNIKIRVYASDEKQAEEKQFQRLQEMEDLGREQGKQVHYEVHGVVNTFTDAASANSIFGVFSNLTPDQCDEFLADWDDERRINPPDKKARRTTLEAECEAYRYRRQKE